MQIKGAVGVKSQETDMRETITDGMKKKKQDAVHRQTNNNGER